MIRDEPKTEIQNANPHHSEKAEHRPEFRAQIEKLERVAQRMHHLRVAAEHLTILCHFHLSYNRCTHCDLFSLRLRRSDCSPSPLRHLPRFGKLRRVTSMYIISFAMVLMTSKIMAIEPDIAAKQLFTRHCMKCHSDEKANGDFTVASLTYDFNDKQNREKWLTVLQQLRDDNMAAKDEPRPPVKDVQNVMNWISAKAVEAERVRRETDGRVVMRRLNRAEYANTVRDLLGVEVDLADLLPPDTSTNGFDNNAELLHTSSFLMRNYLDAADRVLDEAIANEPKPWIQKKRFDIREEKSVKATGSVYRHTDDGVAIFATWESANIRVTM